MEGCAQFSTIAPLSFTSVTSGNEIGVFDDSTDDDDVPVFRNKVYADTSDIWEPSDYPASFFAAPALHTKYSDRTSTGGSTVVSVTTDRALQVWIWHVDAQTSKPAWLASDGYVDCGEDTNILGLLASGYCQEVAAGTINFKGNCPTGGCAADYPMYVVSFLAPSRRLPPPGTPGDAGDYQFVSTSIPVDESSSVAAGQAERVTGSDGAVSVEVYDAGTGTCTSGVEYNAITATTINWSDTESGAGTPNSITITTNAASATCTIDLGFQNATGGISSSGIKQTQTVTVSDTGAPPSGTSFFINNTGTPSCSDANSGSAASPWCNISMLSTVTADAGGDVTVFLDGTFTTQANWGASGTDATHRILLSEASGGNAVFDNTGSYCLQNAVSENFVGIVANGTNKILCKGDAVPTRTSGVADNGMTKVAVISGDNNIFEFEFDDTFGYQAFDVKGTGNIFRDCRFDGTGNPWETAVDETGEVFQFYNNAAVTDDVLLVEGCYMAHGGHNIYAFNGGQVLMRGSVFYGGWDDVATFNAGDGQRWGIYSRESRRGYMDSNVFWETGADAAKGNKPGMKMEGHSTTLTRSILLDTADHAIQANATSDSRRAEEVYIAHNTFNTLNGEALNTKHNAGSPGGSGPIRFYNNAVINASTKVIFMRSCADNDLDVDEGLIEVVGNYFEAGSTIDIASSCGGNGNQTVAFYESNYPTYFHDNVVGGSTNFVDDTELAPGMSTAALATAFAAYETTVGSVLRDAAQPLTVTTNSGSSATNLIVEDPEWWTDGKGYSAPRSGEGYPGDTGCYQVRNITQAWTVCITAVNYTTGELTLASAQTWSIGDSIGFEINDIGARDNDL